MSSIYNSVFGGGNQAQSYQSQGPTALAQAHQTQYGRNAAQSYNSAVRNRGREGTVVGDAFPPATSMELDHPAYEAPVSVLIDMWLVRFGNDWIDIETIDNDDFFRLAFGRLKGMGELEVHYLTDRARYVCRKPK